MKFLTLILFTCASFVCSAQLTEYRMLFPFPYTGDSITDRHIHEIKIQTFYSATALTVLSKPDLVTFFRFDETGRLLSKYNAACDTCKPHPVIIANSDSASVKSHKTKYNTAGQLVREENFNTIDAYGYDKLGRIYFHATVIPLGAIDTSYDVTTHHYGDNGEPDWSVRNSFTIHSNIKSKTSDTVGTRKSYAHYTYKGTRLLRVLADLPTKASNEPRFIINYKYISRIKWQVEFFDVAENKNTCVWKVEEKQ